MASVALSISTGGNLSAQCLSRVSVTTVGEEIDDGGSFWGENAVSVDGRFIVFSSLSAGLVSDDTNEVGDIFVRDRVLQTTTRVSVATDGSEANALCRMPGMSGDGRFVSFASTATNLDPASNGFSQLFVRDRDPDGNGVFEGNGVTVLASVSDIGVAGNSVSLDSSISADGRYAAFVSLSSNLVSNDTNARMDLFVRDLVTETTVRVNVSSLGDQANGSVQGVPSISGDGRIVTFMSAATNLVPNDENLGLDVFFHDRDPDGNGTYDESNGETLRASVSDLGVEGDSRSLFPSVSVNGRYVIYWSEAGNLVADDLNNATDVFIHDLETSTTTLASRSTAGDQGNYPSCWCVISGDGTQIAFQSFADNLVDDDNNFQFDIFHRNLITGVTIRVNVNAVGEEADGISGPPSISANGDVILFRSSGTNLIPGDENGIQDVFVSAPCTRFRRGDCNADGAFDISDAVFLLSALFSAGPTPACDDACDDNDDGQVDIADGVYGLSALFSNGPLPVDPFVDCGDDPTEDDLTCATFALCP